MAEIIVDSRENRVIVKELLKEKLDFEIKQLISADFVIQSKTLDGKIQTIGIERKTIHDLLSSIIDKRLFNQLILLKENFDTPLLILEGEENIYKLRDFHPNAIRGMLIAIAVDFQIPIINSRGIRDTCQILSMLAKRMDSPRKPFTLLDRKKPLSLKEQQLFLLESLHGIGATLSKSLLKEFKTIKNIVNADEKELLKVDKIGKLKAVELKKLFDSDFED